MQRRHIYRILFKILYFKRMYIILTIAISNRDTFFINVIKCLLNILIKKKREKRERLKKFINIYTSKYKVKPRQKMKIR